MPSQAQKHAGYILPEQITDHDLICAVVRVPNVPEYRAAFLGALHELGKWWVWEKSGQSGDTRATEAAAYWRELLELVCMTPICPIDLRQSPTDPCLIEKSYDGETWIDAWRTDICQMPIDPSIGEMLNSINQQMLLDRYNGTPSSVNPNAPDDFFSNNPTRENALCMALQAWVGTIAYNFSIKAGLALGGAGLIVGLLGFFGPAGILAGIVIGGSLGLVSLNALNAAQDEDAIEAVACCMLDALKNQAISHAAFQGALGGCGFAVGSNEQILADVVQAELASEGNYVAFLNELGESFLLSQAGVICEACADEWCFEFDFKTSGTFLGWISHPAGGHDGATIEPGLGIQTKRQTVNTRQSMFIQYEGIYGNIESVVLTYRANYSLTACEVRTENGGSVEYTVSGGFPSGTPATREIWQEPLATWEGNRLYIYSPNGKTPTEYWWLEKITFSGHGVNPFGANNC